MLRGDGWSGRGRLDVVVQGMGKGMVWSEVIGTRCLDL